MAPENRAIAFFSLGVLGLSAAYLVLAPRWLLADPRPGSPVGQSLGIAAGVLMLVTLLYLPLRRAESPAPAKPRAQFLHTLVGTTGVALALAHSRALLKAPPGLVLLAALGLLATGIYGRVVSPQRLGGTFGRSASPYAPAPEPPGPLPSILEIVREKARLLAGLDPGAEEARFILRTRHWVRHPVRAFRYWSLAWRERRLLATQPASATAEIGLLERNWRRLHLILSALFVVGLLAHVVTTLFFAGYVAGGREIYWWHVRR
jgi:hypothetical protein